MHMIFADESGATGYPSNGNWANWGGSKLYTRVGAVIHGRKWKTWNERLILFKKNRGLSWDVEIKASHVRKGKGGFTGWDKSRRDLFLSDLLDLIGNDPDLTLFGIVIDKTNVDVSQSDRLKKPDVRSMELLLERYNFFLKQQTDKSGIVVLDPTQEKNDDNIRYFQHICSQAKFFNPPIVEGVFAKSTHPISSDSDNVRTCL